VHTDKKVQLLLTEKYDEELKPFSLLYCGASSIVDRP